MDADMDAAHDASDDDSDHKIPVDGTDTSKAEAALRAKLSRKRTKTGCLTCRKRRIKCGEERPVCKNCIKSKRHCEGYSQRVVFRPPHYEYRAAPNGGAHITFQAGPMAAPMIQMQPGQMPYMLDPSVYAPQPDQFMPFLQQPGNGFAAPLPPQMMPFSGYFVQPQPGLMQQTLPMNYVQAIGGQPQQQTQPMFQEQFAPVYDTRPHGVQQQPQQTFQTHFPVTYDSRQQEIQLQPQPTFLNPFAYGPDGRQQETQPQSQPPFQTPLTSPHDSLQDDTQQEPQYQTPITADRVQAIPASVQPGPASHFQPAPPVTQAYSTSHQGGIHRPSLGGHDQSWPGASVPDIVPASQVPESQAPAQAPATSISPPRRYEQESTPVRAQSWAAPTYTPRPELSHPIDYQPTALTSAVHPYNATAVPLSAAFVPQPQHPSDPTTPEFYEHEAHAQGSQEHSQWLADAAVEVVDDEYYDVDSDEDMDIDNPAAVVQDRRRQRTLNNVLMRQHFDVPNMQIRRYDTFLQDNMLAHYRVEYHANPLKNPATARVFAHFISATGPSLSVFERHPINSSVLFTEGNVPFAQQGLWTYTMPMAALHHQGLLHAMLALSSLHIARLQNGDTTPSMKHYAWALKRIHACVGSRDRKKRLRVTTIAASMLLGFYEVMTADHMKWNTHLAGAKQLFVETDFAEMTRQYRQLKRERMARDQAQLRRNSISAVFNREEDAQNVFNDVDEAMISNFVGREIRYESHRGYVETAQTKIPEELDLSNFETLKDLFWWYCKQDAFQSIVSGNPLLMDYHRWLDCPPRASMGRPDAVYGSSDHLVLLLGRIADFAAKDRVRKLRQMALQGGQWVPAPGMNIPRPPQPPPGAGPPAGPPPQAPPMFFGMAPPPKSNVQMPSSYNPVHETPNPQSSRSPEVLDLQVATAVALEEYGKIRAALRAFVAALSGDAFQPLDADCHTPLETSFGPALFYRSYDISCLWGIYNMCEIIAIRSHPYMHPAAHVAAGLAAKDTAFYANEIGRIAAGIVPGPANEPLNPTLGSSLCESCMPSFFAAIQYQRPDQRHETVMRIYGIAVRTGWGSAELIGKGIETSWVRAGEMGRGPPYQRVEMPRYSDDPRLNRSWERQPEDPNARPEEMDDNDRRLVTVRPNARLNWAIGVIGLESDVAGG